MLMGLTISVCLPLITSRLILVMIPSENVFQSGNQLSCWRSHCQTARLSPNSAGRIERMPRVQARCRRAGTGKYINTAPYCFRRELLQVIVPPLQRQKRLSPWIIRHYGSAQILDSCVCQYTQTSATVSCWIYTERKLDQSRDCFTNSSILFQWVLVVQRLLLDRS